MAKLAGKAQWIQSYVADNKTFCVDLAETEAAVNEHARLSDFPASKVTEISGIIDPTTARYDRRLRARAPNCVASWRRAKEIARRPNCPAHRRRSPFCVLPR